MPRATICSTKLTTIGRTLPPVTGVAREAHDRTNSALLTIARRFNDMKRDGTFFYHKVICVR